MISRKDKVYYGLGDLSGNIMFGAVSFYLLYFIVNVGGLSPFLAGIVFLVSRVWDAITDYFMGVISDKTKSKYGKRRVYMLFGAIPFGLSFVFLWLTPDTNEQTLKFLYFLFVYVLYNTSWTIVYIPYNSLTANMTDDYDERTSLNTVRIIMANIGLLLGAAVFALLADGQESIFYKAFGSLNKAYAFSGLIFGFIASITMFICAKKTKEKIDNSQVNKEGFFKTLKQFFKLKEFRNIIIYYLLSMVGFDIIMAIFIFFVNDALGFSGGDESMLFVALPLVCAIGSAILWEKLSAKHEKHRVYTVAAIYITVALSFCLIIPANNYFALSAVCIAVGIGMSAIQILPYASVPDVIEIDEYTNGSRREGAYYGIVSLMYKSASGISVGLVSAILGIFGYIEGAPSQPEAVIPVIRIMIGVVPGVFFLVSIIFAHRANISRSKFNFIKQEISKNKNIER